MQYWFFIWREHRMVFRSQRECRKNVEHMEMLKKHKEKLNAMHNTLKKSSLTWCTFFSVCIFHSLTFLSFTLRWAMGHTWFSSPPCYSEAEEHDSELIQEASTNDNFLSLRITTWNTKPFELGQCSQLWALLWQHYDFFLYMVYTVTYIKLYLDSWGFF